MSLLNFLVLYWHALDIWLTARPRIKVALTVAEAAFISTIASYVDGIVTGHTIFDMAGLKRTIVIAVSSALIAVWNLGEALDRREVLPVSNIVTSGHPLDDKGIGAVARRQLADGRPTWDKYEAEIGKAQPKFFQDETIQKQAIDFAKAHYPKSELSPAEVAIKRFEENRDNSKAYRWDGQARWQGRENQERRLVRIMHPYTVLRKLRAAGVDAREEESPHARIWLNSFSRMGRVGINAWVKPEEGTEAHFAGRMIARTLTTLQYPYGPEWSIMRFNEYDVPVNECYRGWRTAMLVLITSDVLTEAEVNRAFGEPIGEASLFYRMQLQAHRTISYGLAKF